MTESGIPYELITPRGTVVFNDFTQTYVTQLTKVTGIRPQVRKSYKNRPHRSGARLGPGAEGAMFPVLEGRFLHTAPSVAESMRRQLEAAAYSILNDDGVLRWQPSDAPSTWRAITVQLYDTPNVEGGLFKDFQVPLIASKPFILGADEHVQDSTLYDASGGGGLTFNFTFSINFADSTGGSTGTFTNDGDNDSWPIIRLWGPITSPIMVSGTLNLAVRLPGLTVEDGQYVDFDMFEETVIGPSGSVSQYVDWTTSKFFPLIPGPNVLSVIGSATSALSTRFTVTWHDSYK